MAKDVLLLAKKFYPHLKYIHITGKHAPLYVRYQIFIGGAHSTVEGYRLKPISDNEWPRIDKMNSIEELHNFVRSYYSTEEARSYE